MNDAAPGVHNRCVRKFGGALCVAVIGTLVLAVVHRRPTGNPVQHAANAMAKGFAVAARAMLTGSALLSRQRPGGKPTASSSRSLTVAG